jgi:hypothetical protein
MARSWHPNKDIGAAVQYAESKGWTDALRDTILEPIKRAIEFLNGKYGDPIEISADLARVSR